MKKFISLLLAAIIAVMGISQTAVFAEESGREINLGQSDELLFSYNSFYYSVNGENRDFTKENGKFLIDSDSYSVLDIDGFGGSLKFDIADPHTSLSEGDYFTFTFPEVFNIEDSSGSIVDPDFNLVIANYELKDNVLKVIMGEAVSNDGITNINAAIGFDGVLDASELGDNDMNDYLIAPKTKLGDEIILSLPKLPTMISGLTKEASEVKFDSEFGRQYVDWTIGVATDSKSSGLSLAGVTLTDTIVPDELEFVGANTGKTYGESESIDFDKTQSSFSYSFAEGTTAPAYIVVRTYLKSDLLEKANENAYLGKGDTISINTVSLDEGTSDLSIDPASKSTNASVTVPFTGITKTGMQTSGNSIDWTIKLNDAKIGFWKAIVSDALSEGLTIDESYGVKITTGSNKKIALSQDAKSDLQTGISYRIESDASNNQTIYFDFGDDSHAGFEDSYTIVFRTNIDSSYSHSGDTNLNSKVVNTAYVQTLYPQGSGNGSGVGRVWGAPSVTSDYLAVYVDEIAKGADKKTGLLSWEINPGTRIEDYSQAVITESLEENYQELAQSPEVKYSDGSVVSASVYDYEYTDGKLIFTFDKEALDADAKTLDDVVISYKTKALEYFRSNNNHKYLSNAKIEISYAGNDYRDTDSANQSLANKLISKSVAVEYNDEKNLSYFKFTIPVNANALTLEKVEVKDALSGIFTTQDGAVIPDDYYNIAKVSVKNADGSADSSATIVSDNASKELSVNWENAISETKTIEIYVTFDADKLSPGEALSQAVISADNTAYITSDSLLGENTNVAASAQSKDNATKLINKAIDKSGSFIKSDDEISWTIEINKAHADISNFLVIEDEIGSGLVFDKDTFAVESNGVDVTDKVNLSITPQADGTTKLNIVLPTQTERERYVITYKTAITTTDAAKRTTGLTNKAYFANEAVKDSTSSTKQVSVSATKSGSAKAKIILNFTKLDSASDTDNPVFVKSALYGAYKDAECKELVASAYTDENGKCAILLPFNVSGNVYYIKEIASNEAISALFDEAGHYNTDSRVYGPYEFTTPGTKVIAPFVQDMEFEGLEAEYFVDDNDITNPPQTTMPPLNTAPTPSNNNQNPTNAQPSKAQASPTNNVNYSNSGNNLDNSNNADRKTPVWMNVASLARLSVSISLQAVREANSPLTSDSSHPEVYFAIFFAASATLAFTAVKKKSNA